MVSRPIGTFSQKIHCQATPWVIAPPSTGPTTTARAITEPKMPIAALAAGPLIVAGPGRPGGGAVRAEVGGVHVEGGIEQGDQPAFGEPRAWFVGAVLRCHPRDQGEQQRDAVRLRGG